MNCNNSVNIEVSRSYEEEFVNGIKTGSVKMARPHTDNEASTSKEGDEGKTCPPLRMLDATKLHGKTLTNSERNCSKYLTMYGVSDIQEQSRGFDLKTGSRPGQVSDDGRSSVSSDSRWKCKSMGPYSIRPTDSSQPNYHSSPLKHHQSENRGNALAPRSGTVSYSSSKSSTPMKQSTSYLSHHTRSSIQSEGPVCRICHEGDQTEVLISPCYCAGSMGLLHISCLQRWLGASNKTTCEICKFQFTITRRAKPIREFLKDPGSARDRRNLICDIISFLLITPLTALTTWLSIVGAYRYYSNSSWEKGGLIGLAVTLWCLYLIWLLVAVRHNWRLWKDWVMFHQDVTLICSPITSNHPHTVDASTEKIGSHSAVSSSTVHLQAIEIKVSGPMNKHKRKEGAERLSKLVAITKPESPNTSEEITGLKFDKHDLTSQERLKQKARSLFGNHKTMARQGNYLPETSVKQSHFPPETSFKQGNYLPHSHTTQGKYLPEASARQGKWFPENSLRHGSHLPDTNVRPDNYLTETKVRQGNYLPETSVRQGNYLPETKVGQCNYLPEASVRQGNYHSEASVRGPVLNSYDNYSHRDKFHSLKQNQSGYHSSQNREHGKKPVQAVWKTPERNSHHTTDPVCDKYFDSAAVFSRGTSPEEADAKTASQKYTEEWLDLKTIEVDRKREGSHQSQGTEGSYRTCSENRSPDKQDVKVYLD